MENSIEIELISHRTFNLKAIWYGSLMSLIIKCELSNNGTVGFAVLHKNLSKEIVELIYQKIKNTDYDYSDLGFGTPSNATADIKINDLYFSGNVIAGDVWNKTVKNLQYNKNDLLEKLKIIQNILIEHEDLNDEN